MAINQRRLYEKNKIGYVLVLFHIVLNVFYSINTIKHMDTSYDVGIFIMITIMLLLVGFLTAVKVQNYSMVWSMVAIIIGLFQFSRLLFTDNPVDGMFGSVLIIALVLSGIFCVLGGLVSIKNTQVRRKCVKEYNRKNDYGIK